MQSSFPNYNQRQRGNVEQVQVRVKLSCIFQRFTLLLTLSLWVVWIN